MEIEYNTADFLDRLGALRREGTPALEDSVNELERLQRVLTRKRRAEDEEAFIRFAAALDDELEQVDALRETYDGERDRVDELLDYPGIDRDRYQDRIDAYDDLVADADSLQERSQPWLAVAGHLRDQDIEPDEPYSMEWKDADTAVREALFHVKDAQRGVTHLINRDKQGEDGVYAAAQECGLREQLSGIRQRWAAVQDYDHDAVEDRIAADSPELAGEYRKRVERLAAAYRELEDGLVRLAAAIAEPGNRFLQGNTAVA